jgi:hypothetical protein
MKNPNETSVVSFSVSKLDESRRLIFGVVYEPNRIDGKGFFMEPEEVEKMAHRFMKLNLSKSIDTQHDNIPNGSYPVQSFIAREGDPDYAEGSWVLGVKVVDEAIWNDIVDGKLNAFSMEIMVKKQEAVVKYEHVPNQVFQTEPAEDGHWHYGFVEVDEMGRIIKGKTSIVDGHYHDIDLNSITNTSAKHSHRYII